MDEEFFPFSELSYAQSFYSFSFLPKLFFSLEVPTHETHLLSPSNELPEYLKNFIPKIAPKYSLARSGIATMFSFSYDFTTSPES